MGGRWLQDRVPVWTANALFVLALFPYFRIIPNLNAEVQPIGGAIGILVWALAGRRSVLVRCLAPLLAVIVAQLVLFLLQVELGSVDADLGAALEALGILIAPLGLAIGLSLVADSLSASTVSFCAFAWALLGTLQLVAPGLLQATGVTTALSAAVPRLAVVDQAMHERGVTMFAPEASYAAPSILLMLVAVLWLRSRGRLTTARFCILLLVVAWMVLLNASASLLIMVILLGAVLVLGAAARRRVLLVPALAIFVCTLWGLGALQRSEVRPLRVAGEMSALVTSGHATLDNLVAVSELNDSARLSSIVQGYSGVVVHTGLGLGLGSWGSWISPFRADTLFHGARPKPFAYGAFASMTLGIPGLAALAWVLARIATLALRRRSAGFEMATLAVAILGIMGNSPASLPAYWVMLVLALAAGRRSSPAETPAGS